MTHHTVKDGEYLVQIAADHGFLTCETIWNHSGNKELAQKRKNPNTLLPGDVVVIPERTAKGEKVSTGKAYRFVAKRDKQKLRMKLVRRFDDPESVAEATVVIDGQEKKVPIQDGVLETLISRTARSGTVRLGEQEISFVVGGLDPIEEPSGTRQRLANLGFDPGESFLPLDPDADDPDLRERTQLADEQLRWAIEEAQLAAGKTPNGILDDAFKRTLEDLHGV